MFLTAVAIPILCISGCAVVNQTLHVPGISPRPAWIVNQPDPLTHFVGISSAEIGGDLNQARRSARNGALREIAEQIEISLSADVRMNEHSVSYDNHTNNTTAIHDRIQTFTKAVLAGWEEINVWKSPDNRYWSMVVLEKKRYYDAVNSRIDDAVLRASDALRAGRRGSAQSRIRELCRGLAVLDEFPGISMRCVVDGRDVALNNEIPQALALLLESITIRPNTGAIRLGPTENFADTVGVYLFCGNRVDNSISVSWSSSSPSVQVSSGTMRADGLMPVIIQSLPASSGRVTIDAAVDFGAFHYELVKRGFRPPATALTAYRLPPAVYVDNDDMFCRTLVQALAARAAIVVTHRPDDAHYFLASSLTPADDTVHANSLYWARATLAIRLLNPNGRSIIDICRPIRSADGISPSRAVDNTGQCALNEAIRHVEGAF